MADLSWEWDETLYAGSAAFYARGRLPYPRALADALRDALGLDGGGRLLDVGCGPGSLTHLIAPLFAEAVGVDADAAMAAEARKHAAANERFVVLRAEELPADLGTFRAATFAQSFHWLDQHRVAAAVHGMLEPGGAAVLVGATTHQGEETDVPREEISELVHRYLGPVRRAGRGSLPQGTAHWDSDAFAGVGFRGPREVEVPAGQIYTRSEDDVVASVYSTSSAAPHLFGDRLEEFESELRAILRGAAPVGGFHERARDITLHVWDR